MDIGSKIDAKNIHHSYLLVGDTETIESELVNFIENKLGFPILANPDFWLARFETFTIDDARNLSDLHLRKPFSAGRKMFIASVSDITVEAQNALLKLFEEPIQGNYFFLITNEEKNILPTLRSRMAYLNMREVSSKESESFGKKFLKSNIADRMKLISKIVEDKDKNEAKKLIRSVIGALRDEYKDEKSLIRMVPVLEDLIHSDDYLSDRSPSIKMILEHMAHIVP
jgi:DNA polymerase III delta prime subunit